MSLMFSLLIIMKVVFFGDTVPKDRADMAMEASRRCFSCTWVVSDDHVCFSTCQVDWSLQCLTYLDIFHSNLERSFCSQS